MVDNALGWTFSDALVVHDGPSSLVEMLDWPRRFVDSLTSDEVIRLRCNAALLDRSTHYSGIDTPVYAVDSLTSFLSIATWRHLCS